MNVLSLFDGMSCGQIALDQLGIKVDNYYASEIDKFAKEVTQKNYPNTIQLGDVTKWKEWNIDWASIDLIQGGSPCQGFSFAGKGLAFDDPRSALFFVMVDIINHIKGVNPKVMFMLENVRMKKDYLNAITKILGVDPIMINSSLVSAQNRVRFYWTNINVLGKLDNRGILLKDILEDSESIDKKYFMNEKQILGVEKSNYRDRKPYDISKSEKMGTIKVGGDIKRIVLENKDWRYLTPKEYERLQTVPDNYTLVPYGSRMMSNSQRYKMLGNGWTVEVIKHIYKSVDN